jgi:drug/metabolite transporter (DMT)-like permease
VLRYDALLLLTAGIWGFAFAAQRAGMQHVGPFLFNGIRFALGSLTLVPLWYLRSRPRTKPAAIPPAPAGSSPASGGAASSCAARKTQAAVPEIPFRRTVLSGLLAGTVLFGGASLQQIGIVYTTAGKSGFITGLYVVLVPLLGLLWGQRAGWFRWIGALLAAAGLYFLSVTERFIIARGDLLVLLSAFFWAGHVLVIARLSPKLDSIKLACLQYAVCSVLSLIAAGLAETFDGGSILAAGIPILYGGICSVGIAYTLQVVAQKKAHPAHAAILLSLEGVFAVLGGWIFLGETLTARGWLGCGLMLTAMLASQSSVIFSRAVSPSKPS